MRQLKNNYLRMKKFFFPITALFFTFTLFSAPAIKGIVVDGTTLSPLEFVNVAVMQPSSKIPAAGGTTNQNGQFVFTNLSIGKYMVRISFVGYKSFFKPVNIGVDTLNIGELRLESDSKTLKEVSVTGQGSQMRIEVDKKVYSVDQSIATAGGSASDALKNIPSVDVDNEGNVALRNNASVEIWINGKPSGLTADNRAQVLQQMPAESVESVEIMTNPSAKYNPDGTAGIINLVLKKNRNAGYYGSVSAGTMYSDGSKYSNGMIKPGGTLGTSFNYSSSKIDAYLNLGYRQMNKYNDGWSRRFYETSKDSILQGNSSNNGYGGLFSRGGFDYHLDNKNTISLSGLGFNMSRYSDNLNHFLFTAPLPIGSYKEYSRKVISDGEIGGGDVNLDFRHDFDTKGTFLTSSLSYSKHIRYNDEATTQTNFVGTTNQNQIQHIEGESDEYVFKLDYTQKIGDAGKFESGLQSQIKNRESLSDGSKTTNTPFINYYNEFNYLEKINAAYFTFGNRYDKLNLQAGLRGEMLSRNSTNEIKDSLGTIIPQPIPVKSSYRFFPSLFVSYSLPNKNEIQLNVTSRVNRPHGSQLNPFLNYSDLTNISHGNADLTPEYSYATEFNYIKSWDEHTLSGSLYYRYNDNVIQTGSFLNKNNVMESTSMNISHSQNTGLELVSKNRFFTILSLTSTVNVFYGVRDSSTYIDPYDPSFKIKFSGQENLSWNVSEIANVMLSKTLSGQITAKYISPQLINQGIQKENYFVDFGLRQSFFDRKLNVSFTLSDIFNSRRSWAFTNGKSYSQESYSFQHGRMFGLSVSYNFGNIKPKKAEKMKKEGNGEGNMEGVEQ